MACDERYFGAMASHGTEYRQRLTRAVSASAVRCFQVNICALEAF